MLTAFASLGQRQSSQAAKKSNIEDELDARKQRSDPGERLKWSMQNRELDQRDSRKFPKSESGDQVLIHDEEFRGPLAVKRVQAFNGIQEQVLYDEGRPVIRFFRDFARIPRYRRATHRNYAEFRSSRFPRFLDHSLPLMQCSIAFSGSSPNGSLNWNIRFFYSKTGFPIVSKYSGIFWRILQYDPRELERLARRSSPVPCTCRRAHFPSSYLRQGLST